MSIPIQPGTISSETLSLVPFGVSHITSDYIGWLNDRVLMKYSEQRHRHHDQSTCHLYLQSMLSAHHYFWAIINCSDNIHIGNITAYLDRPNLTANLAIMIGHSSAKGRGFGLAGWQLAMEHLFKQGIRKVGAGTMSINHPMIAIFQKSGMTTEGVLKDHFIVDNQLCDMILAAKFKGNNND